MNGPVTAQNLPNQQPSSKEALEYLKTRSIFIATPCYGGQMCASYTRSLLALTNLCHDLGIKYAVSFLVNESLIPRARNAMVADYLKNSDYTDFFFIDADIGFDARDIVSFLLHPEEIVGVPYPRKSINWARIIDCLQKNNGNVPLDELSKLTGEYVFNFPADAAPASINLGEMLEVQDVGTGLLRVKREAFAKIREAFPDRVYMPMVSEGELIPTYMYFQSEIDPESAKFSPTGLPNYCPEDFMFCRLARKAGLKIHLAPWVKTTHSGHYSFIGDLEAVGRWGGRIR